MEIRWHEAAIAAIEEKLKKAAYETMNDIRRDVDQDQTVPFRDGTLNDSAFVQLTSNSAELHYSTPYAMRQYYEPMNHYVGQHMNATDHWLDPYVPKIGSKGDFISEHMLSNLRKNL